MFAEYIDWRADHPSDDLMTQLLNAELEEDGEVRRLTRTEVLMYTGMVAGAGNETTTRLIGFAGQLLADNPDQRRELADDYSLIPRAIEEMLRYEAPSPVQARYVAHDVECRGQTIPEGSVMLLLNGSANRDERHFPDPDRFDIHRSGAHLSFGQGLHFCLGRRWPVCRRGLCSRRCCGDGPIGKSTTTTPKRRTPQACADGRSCRSRSASRHAANSRVAQVNE